MAIQPLALEHPHAAAAALKIQKKEGKGREGKTPTAVAWVAAEM